MKRMVSALLIAGGILGAGCADGQGGSGKQSTAGGKVLVVYYSATGATRAVAQKIADYTGGTLFEAEPAQPYSAAGLDWTDKKSRVSREHETIFAGKANGTASAADVRKVRVALKESTVPDSNSYDTVFIGAPVWWGIAAWPVNTFVTENDFSGKTVVPFTTAMSSGIGRSGELLQELAGGKGRWLSGRGFKTRASEKEVQSWIDSLQFN